MPNRPRAAHHTGRIEHARERIVVGREHTDFLAPLLHLTQGVGGNLSKLGGGNGHNVG